MDLDRRKFLQFAGAATAAGASLINDIVTFEAEATVVAEPIAATALVAGTGFDIAAIRELLLPGIRSWEEENRS